MGQAPSGGAKSMGAGEAGHQRTHRRGREEDAQALGARASRSSQIRLDPEPLLNRFVKFAMLTTRASSTTWSSPKYRLNSSSAPSRSPAPAARVSRSA